MKQLDQEQLIQFLRDEGFEVSSSDELTIVNLGALKSTGDCLYMQLELRGQFFSSEEDGHVVVEGRAMLPFEVSDSAVMDVARYVWDPTNEFEALLARSSIGEFARALSAAFGAGIDGEQVAALLRSIDAGVVCESVCPEAGHDADSPIHAVQVHALLASQLKIPRHSVGVGYRYIARGEVEDLSIFMRVSSAR